MSLKHRIIINYETGDSFGSETVEQFLELEWKDLDIAKKNLARISDHYKFYRDLNDFNINKSAKNIHDRYKREDWYSGSEFSIKLEADNGNTFQISCFWCGYFEILNWAEIISEDDDMRIEF